MPDWDPSFDAFGQCARSGCEEPCPWDMASIMLGEGVVCCSPACAETVLEGITDIPNAIALHDPQYAVDRVEIDGVPDESVDIYRLVDSRDEAKAAIQDAAELYPGRFRIARDESEHEDA